MLKTSMVGSIITAGLLILHGNCEGKTPATVKHIDSNEPGLVQPSQSTEAQLVSDFHKEWLNRAHGARALRALAAYYKLTGQDSKLDVQLAKAFEPPPPILGCGTGAYAFADAVGEYCRWLKASGDPELIALAERCISYADITFSSNHLTLNNDTHHAAVSEELDTTPELLPGMGDENLAKVRVLTLTNGKLTRETIEIVADKIPDLKSLQLRGFKPLPVDAIATLPKFEHLEILEFVNCDFQDDAFSLTGNFNSLKSLAVMSCKVSSLDPTNLQSVERLELKFNKFSDAELSKLCKLKNLKELKLTLPGSVAVDSKSLALDAISKLSRLQKLELFPGRIRLQNLGKLNNLEELSIYGAPVTKEIVEMFKGLPKLRILQFSIGGNADTWLPTLCTYPALTRADFRGSYLSPSNLALLSKLKTLEELRLPQRYANMDFSEDHQPPPIRDEDLAFLKTLPNLRVIAASGQDISGTAFSDDFMTLESLDLTGCPATDQSLIALSRLPKLKKLVLAHTKISGKVIADLPQKAQIEELILTGSRAHFAPADLYQFTSLRNLGLMVTQYRLSELYELKKQLTDCAIHPEPEELDKFLSTPPRKQ